MNDLPAPPVRSDLESRLRSALRDGGVHAALQPIFRGQRPIAVEALARFDGPLEAQDVGRVIAIAEASELVGLVSEAVLRDALELLSAWPGWHGQLAWNVSPRHLARPDFERRLVGVLGRFDFPLERLLIEVTESAFADAAQCVPVLSRLRARGASVAVDDFGTGSSSIGRLLRLPVDVLKIDGALVAELPSARGVEVVRSVRALAAALGAGVVAEGVERRGQLDALTTLDDVMVQGYLTGPPTRDVRRALIGSTPPRDHGMVLHDRHDAFHELLADFVVEGIDGHDAIMFFLTADHDRGLRAVMARRGLDLESLIESGSVSLLDAEHTLARIAVGGRADASVFERIVAGPARVEARAGRRVRAYGDMVSLLWEHGDMAGALELEELWNQLGAEVPLTLLCGFPLALAAVHHDLLAVQSVHGYERSVPPEPNVHLPVAAERRRVAELHALRLVRAEPDPQLDSLLRVARAALDVEMAWVSIIDETRQRLVARSGVGIDDVPREAAFCAYTILDERPLVVLDARRDERFQANPLVLEEPHLAFYAGMPIHGPSGARIGSVCVAQSSPRAFSEADEALLADVAAVVDGLIARRAASAIDTLTGLFGRHGLEEALRWAVAEYGDRAEVVMALARLDGVQVADPRSQARRNEAMALAAQALTDRVRDAVLVARTGDAELCVLFVDMPARAARAQVIRALRAVGALDDSGDLGLTVLSATRRSRESAADFLARAERALAAGATAPIGAPGSRLRW